MKTIERDRSSVSRRLEGIGIVGERRSEMFQAGLFAGK